MATMLGACSGSVGLVTEPAPTHEPSPAHPVPPERRVSLWADDDLTIVEDHCGEYLRIGTQRALRGDGVGVTLPGWELSWWLDEGQMTRLGETAREVSVGNWSAADVHGAIQVEAAIRMGNVCEPAIAVSGLLRWDDGEPVVKDPAFGLQGPRLEFALTEEGEVLRSLLEEQTGG